ncbi:hypothetical protein GW937_00690 [Candidatus Kaiserbacteria bacterium]|nr:hypothetical protein [Candidatus Kaiserbacteria bacterium]NCT01867.1 hypothetical protein [Candidatus Parcubacteria bacterium]
MIMKTVSAFLLWVILGTIPLGMYPALAEATSLYLDPPTSKLYRGDSMSLAVRLDTVEAEGECVNAVDAVITYAEGIEPVDTSIGDSILRIWVEEPTIDREARTITFAGGIPNGYCGRIQGDPRLTNVLAKIIFQSPGFSVGAGNTGQALVSFTKDTTAYLNDGQGTKATLTTFPATIVLDTQAGQTIANPWQAEVTADRVPPEDFSISLQRDEKAFSQKYYIVFSTTDKQTGVDHYQVMEEPSSRLGLFEWGRADAPWIETRSPYVLKDQSLHSVIRVKAIDKAGNEYIATLVPDESLKTVTTGTIILVVGVLFILTLLGMVLFVLLRSLHKRRSASAVAVAENDTENSGDNLYE